MARNGSGLYSLIAGNPIQAGSTSNSTLYNNTLSDIATALTQSIAKDGQTVPSANLPMGTYRHTGVGDASARTDYASAKQVQDGTLTYLTSVSGTNTITATAAVSMSAYAAGQHFVFIPANDNTGATTINLNSIGAKNIYQYGAALSGGELVSGTPAVVVYDGTQFNLVSTSPNRTIRATQATTSGTSVEFTSIPAWCNEFVLTLIGVSVDGETDGLAVQLGDSGGYETTGYFGSTRNLNGGTASTWSTSALVNPTAAGATNTWHGQVRGVRYGASLWSISTQVGSSALASVHDGCGSKILSAKLDRVKLFLPTATDAFDNGAVGMVLLA